MSNKKNEIAVTEKSLLVLFGESKDVIAKYSKFAEEIVIEDDDTLSAAEMNSGSLNDFLKSVEDKRKELKAPYFDAGKAIDAFAKKISEPLTIAKKKINDTIANWKRVQEAAAKAEKERIEKEAADLADAKASEIDKITRIESQLIARLFGGYWMNKENQRKTSAGCANPTDCDNLKEMMEKSLPPVDAFKYMQEEYKAMIADVESKLSQQKVRLIEMASSSSTVSDNAKSEAETAKAEAVGEINDKKDEMTQEVIKENRDTLKTQDKEIKEAGKGVRKTLQFEVVDIAAVPKEWIKLDDVAVRAWAQENKELVKTEMSDNTGIINGIKFTLKETYVAK